MKYLGCAFLMAIMLTGCNSKIWKPAATVQDVTSVCFTAGFSAGRASEAGFLNSPKQQKLLNDLRKACAVSDAEWKKTYP
jgi:hypothetical protein